MEEIRITREPIKSMNNSYKYKIYCSESNQLIWVGFDHLPVDIVFNCFGYTKEKTPHKG